AEIGFEHIDRIFELDMLYLGQTHTVSVPVSIPGSGLTREGISAAFDAAYKEAFGRLLDNIQTRVMNYRIAVVGRRPKLDMAVFAPVDGKTPDECLRGTRRVYADGMFHETKIYDRLGLAVGSVIKGPAILEQA